jgi:hypothetical protein
MARAQNSPSWRLQALTKEGGQELSDGAHRAFEDAANLMQQPGAFDSRSLVVDAQAFAELTGFHPHHGEFISASGVRRAAEAATADRTKALANCRGRFRSDYTALGVFLRVCAVNGLGLRAEKHSGKRTGLADA